MNINTIFEEEIKKELQAKLKQYVICSFSYSKQNF